MTTIILSKLNGHNKLKNSLPFIIFYFCFIYSAILSLYPSHALATENKPTNTSEQPAQADRFADYRTKKMLRFVWAEDYYKKGNSRPTKNEFWIVVQKAADLGKKKHFIVSLEDGKEKKINAYYVSFQLNDTSGKIGLAADPVNLRLDKHINTMLDDDFDLQQMVDWINNSRPAIRTDILHTLVKKSAINREMEKWKLKHPCPKKKREIASIPLIGPIVYEKENKDPDWCYHESFMELKEQYNERLKIIAEREWQRQEEWEKKEQYLEIKRNDNTSNKQTSSIIPNILLGSLIAAVTLAIVVFYKRKNR